MEHYTLHYTSGLQFLLDQSQKNKDWQSFFYMLPKVAKEVLEETCRSSHISIVSKYNHINSNDKNVNNNNNNDIETLINKIYKINTNNNNNCMRQIWQLWRWKPPVQSSLQTHDYYFHNPISTPHTIMNEFKKYLSVSKDLKFNTNDLRRLAQIEYQPLMSFVTQDDYDDHTDSMVRSYFIFKDDVMPLWEDEYNVFGGCWSLIWNNEILREKIHEIFNDYTNNNNNNNMNNNKGSKKISKFIWKQVINLLTHPLMEKYVDEICGVGLTIRSNRTYKITVWNRNSDDTITKMMIGQNIKSILDHSGPMFYYSHKSTLQNQYEKKKIHRRSKTFSKENNSFIMNNNNNNRIMYQEQQQQNGCVSSSINNFENNKNFHFNLVY